MTDLEVGHIVNDCTAFMREGLFLHTQPVQRLPANTHPAGSYKGPRTLTISRDKDGFGFTLRYFIVHPPSGLLDSKKEEGFHRNSYWSSLGLGDDGNPSRNPSPLPLDTFFVRHVVAGSSADRAGLNNGDRVVSVNGHLIGGQPYKDVLDRIQHCDGDLKLGVVPRDEDILQLVYQEYVRDAANLEHMEGYDHKARDIESANMQQHPSVNKWNTRLSARKPSTPTETNAEEKKFEPCVSFIGGTPIVNKSLSSSISTSGANTPGFAPSGTSSPPHGRNSARADRTASTSSSGANTPAFAASGTSSPPNGRTSGKGDPTVSFAGGISKSQSSPDGESNNEGVAAQALQTALRKQVAKSSYGRGTRLAPKMIEGVNRPGTVSKIAGVFAEDGSVNVESKPLQRKSSVTSILRDDFRGNVLRANAVDDQGWLVKADDERGFSNTLSTQREPESRKGISLALQESSAGSTSRSVDGRKVTNSSDKISVNLVLGSSSGKLIVHSPVPSTGKKTYGPSAEHSDDDDSQEGSGDEDEHELGSRALCVKTAGVSPPGQKSGLDTIEADDEDSDVNSASSHLKTSSNESLDEDATRNLPIIKEGDLNRKLEKSVDRKRASAKTWKAMRAVLQGQKLYCHKEKGIVNDEDLAGPISICGAQIEIALNYAKRKHVFRVSTKTGNDYLFQASGTQDMMSWVNTLRECSQDKENAFAGIAGNDSEESTSPPTVKASVNRRGLSIKKSHFSLSRGSSKKRVNVEVTITPKSKEGAGKTFGVPLQSCPKSKLELNVPLIVEHCCNYIEDKGKELVGIYRVPGNAAAVLALQTELDAKQPAEINWAEDKWYELNNLSSLLKSYLRKLPEPVIPSSMYEKIIQASRVADLQSRLLCIKNIVKQLPEYHYETLRFLVKHLKVITDHSEKNKMEPKNIAIVFGPTIVRPSEENMMIMVKDMSDQCKIIETLVHQCDWIFGNAEQQSPIKDQTDLAGASRCLLGVLENANDCEATKRDKIANSVQKGFSNLKTNFSMKIKNSAKGVSPIFPKRVKSEPGGGSEEESDEEGRVFTAFTRSNSIPSEARVPNKARLRFRSDDENEEERPKYKSGVLSTTKPNERQTTVREIKVSNVDGVPTKMGSFQAGSELQVRFVNKFPDSALPPESDNRKDIFDASKGGILTDKTRSRLQPIGSCPQWPKDDDEDSGVTVGNVRRGSDDAITSTSDSNSSSRKASFDSLSGPSPLIQRRQQPLTSRQVSSSSDDRSPHMSNRSAVDSSEVTLRGTAPQYPDTGGVLVRRRRNMPLSPRASKRELYSISPGDSIDVDEKLRAMLAENEYLGSELKTPGSNVLERLQADVRHALNGPVDPLKTAGESQCSGNAEWWLSGPTGEIKRQPTTPRDKAAAVSIISSAINSTGRAPPVGSASVEGPPLSDRMAMLSPTTLRRAGILQPQPASFNPELSARVDTFKQKKVELEKKVSRILAECPAHAPSRAAHAIPAGAGIGIVADNLADETKQEKLDRYLQQVSILLKESESRRALKESDRQRLSMILQSLQRAVLLDCVKQEPERVDRVVPNVQSWSRPSNVPGSKNNNNNIINNNNNNNENFDNSAGYTKYSKLYPR